MYPRLYTHTWGTKVLQIHYMYECSLKSQFPVPFALRAAFLRYYKAILREVYWVFMALHTTRPNVLHICVTSVPESQISFYFTMTRYFQVTGLFEISQWDDPKITFQTLLSMVHHIYLISVPQCHSSPKFYFFFLHNDLFSRYMVVKNCKCVIYTPNLFHVKNWKCTKWSQTDLEYLMIKSTLYTLKKLPPSPKFRSVSLYGQPFSDT